MYVFNKEELIGNLERLIDENNKDSYKMMLAKAYTKRYKNISKAEELIEN